MRVTLSRRTILAALTFLPFAGRAVAAPIPNVAAGAPAAPSAAFAALWAEAQAAIQAGKDARRLYDRAFPAIERMARLSAGPDEDPWDIMQRHSLAEALRKADRQTQEAIEAVFTQPGESEADDKLIMDALDLYDDHGPIWGVRQVARTFFTPARFASLEQDWRIRALYVEQFEKYDDPPPWFVRLHGAWATLPDQETQDAWLAAFVPLPPDSLAA